MNPSPDWQERLAALIALGEPLPPLTIDPPKAAIVIPPRLPNPQGAIWEKVLQELPAPSQGLFRMTTLSEFSGGSALISAPKALRNLVFSRLAQLEAAFQKILGYTVRIYLR